MKSKNDSFMGEGLTAKVFIHLYVNDSERDS